MLEQLIKQKVRMVRTCSYCKTEKESSKFAKHYCKECIKYRNASRRYNISFEKAKEFYRHPTCMCCNQSFVTRKDQHLHHVKHKVHGVLCKYCNLALRQETNKDAHRILSCLEFMSKPRKNLFDRANQQGSQQLETDPSTTERPAHLRQCKMCNNLLPFNMFYKQKYKSGKYGYYASCKECHKIFVKTYKYGLTFDEVKLLRATINCDCCDEKLIVPYIHHIGNNILGIVCLECNILLEQESQITKLKLEACKRWMVMIQSDLHRDMQRHTEMMCPTN